MLERVTRDFGRLVFDRDATVRAALRAYVETYLERIARFGYPACFRAGWTGDPRRGAIYNDDSCGNYEVVAWNEAGVVGLAYEAWQGPIEQLGLSVDAVTGGPDDVRGAVPGLPAELETLLRPTPDPKRVLGAQRRLQKVGITWPGSPEIPD